MAQATTIIGLAQEIGIRRKLLYQWRDQFSGERQGLVWSNAEADRREVNQKPFPRHHPVQLNCESPELERLLGRKQLEVDFLSGPSNK